MPPLEATSALLRLQLRLLDLRFGLFQPQHLLERIYPPPVAKLLLELGKEVRPKRVVFDNWRPLDCHRSALEMALRCGGSAWFGFSFSPGRWWVHSWLLVDHGIMLDFQEFSREPCWLGVPWGREVFEGLGGRGYVGVLVREDSLLRVGLKILF